MAFIDDYGTGTNDDFKKRVAVALTKAATTIVGEAKGTMSDITLGKRHDYAMQVIWNPGDFLKNVPFVLAAAGLSTAATDTQLVTTLTANWNKLAGVKSTDG